jgi:hypothetical protein
MAVITQEVRPEASAATAEASPSTIASTDAASSHGVVQVPSSIDATGEDDVARALQRFVDRVPDGSVINFSPAGTYRLSHGIRLTDRTDLVFDGNGATLLLIGSGDLVASSAFFLADHDTGITIQDFTIVGNNPTSGTPAAYHYGIEDQMGVAIYGGEDIEVTRVHFRDLFGDCVYIGSTGTHVWSSRVRFTDSTCTSTGRHGVTIIAGQDVLIEDVTFDQIGMFVVDIEPDDALQGASGVTVRDNWVGTYGLNSLFTSWLLAAEGAEGAVVSDVELIGNVISGSAASGHEGKALGLHVTVRDIGVRENFVVRDNVSMRVVVGPSLQFIGVTGVIVTGNSQPLASGDLVRDINSTEVVAADNVTTVESSAELREGDVWPLAIRESAYPSCLSGPAGISEL